MSHARIFGDETGQRGPSAIRDNINKSSIPGGIFGSDPLPRRPPSNITASSVEGGIFKQPAAVPTPNPPTRQQHTPRDTMQETLTGIGGWARDDSTTTRLDPNVHPIAGLSKHAVHDGVPLQSSFKHDPNRSSIQGGIFADCSPMAAPANPTAAQRNSSSITLG